MEQPLSTVVREQGCSNRSLIATFCLSALVKAPCTGPRDSLMPDLLPLGKMGQ